MRKELNIYYLLIMYADETAIIQRVTRANNLLSFTKNATDIALCESESDAREIANDNRYTITAVKGAIR